MLWNSRNRHAGVGGTKIVHFHTCTFFFFSAIQVFVQFLSKLFTCFPNFPSQKIKKKSTKDSPGAKHTSLDSESTPSKRSALSIAYRRLAWVTPQPKAHSCRQPIGMLHPGPRWSIKLVCKSNVSSAGLTTPPSNLFQVQYLYYSFHPSPLSTWSNFISLSLRSYSPRAQQWLQVPWGKYVYDCRLQINWLYGEKKKNVHVHLIYRRTGNVPIDLEHEIILSERDFDEYYPLNARDTFQVDDLEERSIFGLIGDIG